MSGYGTVRMGVGSPATSLNELVDTVTERPGQRLTLETLRDLVVLRSAATKACAEQGRAPRFSGQWGAGQGRASREGALRE